MPYKVVRPWNSKEWIVEQADGTYVWGPYEKAKKFSNWFKAKAAYDTMEPIRDSYGMLVKPNYMRVS